MNVITNAKIPLELRLALKNADVLIYAHNNHLDRTISNHAMPGVAAGDVDTMVRSLAHGLPGSLGDLCDILNVAQDKAKDKAGKKTVNEIV
ncbi:hypothetical protein [Serratia symbiotica]|nr:hypothetical protein [Serratia symbiotica]